MALRHVSLDDKYRQENGQIFLTGVQALVRLPMLQRHLDAAVGLNTAGFVTGYPGSPLASYDMQLRQARALLKENRVHFQPGLNEDLAMTSVWGSQQGEARGDSRYDGVFAMWYGKGAGLDRSGDALRHGNLAGASRHGGVLLLLGDDHRAESSSVAHYAEYTMVDFMMPVLNPADISELIEFGLFGIALSRFTGSWAGLKCLHDVVESAGSIRIDSSPRDFRIPADARVPPGGFNLRYPDAPLAQEQRLHGYRLEAIRAFARANGIDRPIWRRGDSRFGIVTTGKTYLDVLEALEDLGIDEAIAARLGVAVYKVAMSWPLEPQGALAFADGLDTVFVVEEKRSLLEAQFKDLLYHRAGGPQILGKTDAKGAALFPSTGVLTSNQIAIEIGRRLVARPGGEVVAERLRRLEQRETAKILPLAPLDRKPAFCSGCPHNRSTVVPENSRGGAGTGCNYMAMWMDRGSVGYTQMGADGVNWIGEAPFSARAHVFQNLGDGTYTHSGLLAIRACIAAQVNITFKILFNGVVAMTGGQQHDVALTVPLIARQVLAEGARRVVVVTDDVGRDLGAPLPDGVTRHDRSELDRVQRELRDIPGVTVLIYDQMCATEKRRRRKRGLLDDPPRRAFINHLVCEGCGDCGVKSSCVSILPRETALGRKREIDQYSCNKDYSCTEGFCPSFVSVHGGDLRKAERPAAVATPLTDPPAVTLDRPFNIVLSGIGGSGVVTLAAVLGMAAHLEGKGCATLDMMGLAQKGGAVTSHLRIAGTPADIRAARVPGACADLVLGGDIVALVGAEPISTIGAQTAVLINTHEVMPGDFARQRDLAFPMAGFRDRLEAVADRDRIVYMDANARAREAVGDTVTSNTYMLGFAFQRGLVPLSAAAIERAFELNGAGVDLNKTAFRAGREAAMPEPRSTDTQAAEAWPMGLPDLVAYRAQLLAAYQNEAYARAYRDFVGTVREAEARLPGGATALTRAVAENLAKLMAYKDEYEVARLYTTGEFEADLRRQFGGDFRLSFHLAPPLLAPREAGTGYLRKITFGPWILPVFRLLKRFRMLRGTLFDPFGHTAERRVERQLVRDYRTLVSRLLGQLTAENHDVAIALASLPQDIRGFGHVKAASIARVKAREAELSAQMDSRPGVARGIAA